MYRSAKNILVIRVIHNMVFAITTQNINVVAYNLDNHPVLITPKNVESQLQFSPRIFHNRTVLDEFVNIFILLKLILSIKPDVVHINALQDLFSAFIAVKICKLCGVKPVIVTMSHNPLTWKNSKRPQLIARYIQYLSNGFVALSSIQKDQMVQLGVPSKKIAFIPNSYDPTYLISIPSSYQKRHGVIRIIYVADICRRKDQEALVHAAKEVLKKYPNVVFDLIGKVVQGEEDYAERIAYLIRQYGIEDAVHIVGEVPSSDISSYLQVSDIFVFPTRSEMMPRAVIEAMVVGKPVIASAVDGILDLVKDRETGILMQPGNTAELAAAICELIDDPSLRIRLGSAGQEFILEFCSPDKVGNQYQKFYENILNENYFT